MFKLKSFGKLISKTKAVSKSMLSIVLTLCLLAVMLPAGIGLLSAAAEEPWDGTTVEPYANIDEAGAGTADNPYKIANAKQLAFLSAMMTDEPVQTAKGQYQLVLEKDDQGKDKGRYQDKYFVLTANIDLNNHPWTPIGSKGKEFVGNIDGAGYTITGLKVDLTTDYVGFISRFSAGVIRNLTIYGDVTGGAYVGGFVGEMISGSSIDNCGFSGNIVSVSTSNGYAGAMTGRANGSAAVEFKNCWSAGSVKGTKNNIGGLVGNTFSYGATTTPVTLVNCYSVASVSRNGSSTGGNGGLVGTSNNLTALKNCYFGGAVDNGCPLVGQGAGGTAITDLSNVYYKADSFVGELTGGIKDATGAVVAVSMTADQFKNGELATLLNNNVAALKEQNFVGLNEWMVAPGIDYPIFYFEIPELTGLTVGDQTIELKADTYSYVATVSSGETINVTPTAKNANTVVEVNGTEITGGTPAQITLSSTGTTEVEIVLTLDKASVTYSVTIIEDSGLPKWDGVTLEPYANIDEPGAGTAENPYEIENGAQLAFLSAMMTDEPVQTAKGQYQLVLEKDDEGKDKGRYQDKFFVLTANIDLNNHPWTPIGAKNKEFVGNIDGAGYTITGLKIDLPAANEYVGFIGRYSAGTIRNLNIVGNVAGGQYLGGIVGEMISGADMYDCSFTGDVVSVATSNSNVGGLVGRVNGSDESVIQNCWVAGFVTGNRPNVAGLIGNTFSYGATSTPVKVINCYCVATVSRPTSTSAAARAGGLIGTSNGTTTLKNCYFGGVVDNPCPLVGGTGTVAITDLENVFYKAGSYAGETADGALKDATGAVVAVEKTADEFKNGNLAAALNAGVVALQEQGYSGLNEWMVAPGYDYPIFCQEVPELTGLTVGDQTIELKADTYSYTTAVPHGTESVIVTPVVKNANTAIKVNGKAIVAGTPALVEIPSGARTTEVKIVLTLGSMSATYTVIVEDAGNPKWDGVTLEPYANIDEAGAGTADNPYKISNAAQLAFLSAMMTDEPVQTAKGQYQLVLEKDDEGKDKGRYQDKFFVLTANIDLNNHPWTPIGAKNKEFVGNIDGAGYTITGLKIDLPAANEYVGFIGRYSAGTIRNLNIVGNVAGGQYLGGIVGEMISGADMYDCSFTGDVVSVATSNSNVGGLVGRVNGSDESVIQNCWVAGFVTGNRPNVAGLIGNTFSYGATSTPVKVINCYCVATVSRPTSTSAAARAGGLIGTSNGTTTLKNCYFGGVVDNPCPLVGGTGTVAITDLENVFYKAGSYAGETADGALKDATGAVVAVEKTAEEFANGNLTAALNAGVAALNAQGYSGLNEWMTVSGVDHPVYKEIYRLAGLNVSIGSISFDSAVFSYDLTVRHTVDSITVTPSAKSGLVITVNGTVVESGKESQKIYLTLGETATIKIELAPEGMPTTTYTVNVTRSAQVAGEVWDGTYEKFANYGQPNAGKENNPYQIANAKQLAFLAAMVNNQTVTIDGETITPPTASNGLVYDNEYFLLTGDILLNDVTDSKAWGTTAPANNWAPIGGVARSFAGTIDGAGRIISGLYSKGTTAVGLFGSVSTATLKNIAVMNAYVEGVNNVGGIVGQLGDYSALEKCSFNGAVVATGTDSYVGGLVGKVSAMDTTIDGCSTEGTVSGVKYVGGLVGGYAVVKNSKATINYSYSAMDVTASGTAAVGGLVGEIGGEQGATITITNAHFAGTVTGSFPIVGSVDQTNGAVVTMTGVYFLADCCTNPTVVVTEQSKSAAEFANGTVTALLNQGVAGGWGNGPAGYPIIIASGPVLKNLVFSDGTIDFDPSVFAYTVPVKYAVSSVTFTPTVEEGTTIKVNGVDVQNGILSTAIALDPGVSNRVTIEVTLNGVTKTYVVNVARAAKPPAHIWDGTYEAFDTSNGAGSSVENPILINNAQQLAFFAAMVNGTSVVTSDGKTHNAPSNGGSGVVYTGTFFKLTTDITLNTMDDYANWETVAPDNSWTPIGFFSDKTASCRMFGGTFDGDHHTVRGMYINTPDRDGTIGTGFFGSASGAIIRNVYLTDSYVLSTQRVGGIVGRVRGSITVQNCSFSGTIESNVFSTQYSSNLGGIIGDLNGKATVNSCWTEGTIIGGKATAGLVGNAWLSGAFNLTNSYSAVTVICPDDCTNVGGLVGYGNGQGGTVSARGCHFAGSVPNGNPIFGGTTSSITLTADRVYYRADSIAKAANDEFLVGAEVMSVDAFKNGVVTELLNQASAYGDFWKWKDGTNGYPVSDGIILVTDYNTYVDDSSFDDGNWADKFVNKDGGSTEDSDDKSDEDSNDDKQDSPITGEKSIYFAVILLLLGSAVAVFFLAGRKRSTN